MIRRSSARTGWWFSRTWRPANTVVHNDTEELTIDRIDNNGMLGKTRRLCMRWRAREMKNFVLAGVEDARYMTLEYAEALRESGCYLEMDKNGHIWIYRERKSA